MNTVLSGTRQFRRQAEILINSGSSMTGSAISIRNLRVVFSVKKTSNTDFNTASIQVYNLSRETREKINTIELENIIIIKAGYSQVGEDPEVIFVGNTVLSSIDASPPNVITKIEAQDGKVVMNQLKFSISYQPGTFAKKILKDILNRTTLNVKYIDWKKIVDKQYKNGFCFQGDAKVLFTNVCNYLGLEWSVQDNHMKLLLTGQTDTAKIIYLTPETGLIGSPEKLKDDATAIYKPEGKLKPKEIKITGATGKKYKKTVGGGYKIKCLLQPFAEPGSVVQVKCGDLNDVKLRILEVEHIGDTHGNDWYTTINAMVI